MLLINCTYYNAVLNIAFNNWQQVYLLGGQQPVLLKPETHRSALVYRLPGTARRISYKKIKLHTVKKQTSIWLNVLPTPEKINWL